MKKLFSAILALAMLLGIMSAFFGCKDQSDEQEMPKFPIVANGVSSYVIIYPEVPSAAETEAVAQLRADIKDVTGLRLKAISEEFMEEEPDAKRIYVGNTTFAPAQAAKARLSQGLFDSFVIDASEGDIYIVGASETALLSAVAYYAEHLLGKNYDSATETLLFEGCHFDGTTAFPAGFSVKNICEYSIVYANNGMSMQSIARSVQEAIESATGFEPDIYADTERAEGSFEILVGETNRSLSERSYRETSRMMEYEIVVEGCQLQLAFGGYYSGQKLVNEFSRKMLKSKQELFASGGYYKTDLANVEQELTAGADVRIMSANVLSYRWGEASNSNVLPAAQRAEIFAGVLLRYRPDATGLQETDEPWQQVLPWYLERMKEKDGVEYTFLFGTLAGEEKTMVNFSTIVYRSDLYQLDESGFRIFSIWDVTPNYYQRVATYVKLTAKADPQKQFALVNTHWAHEDHETVNACAVEQAALVNELKAKYAGVTVFCTGDYNNLSTREWGDRYLNQLVAGVSGRIASAVAKEKGVLITPGGCRGSAKNMHENVLREVDNDFIDHVIISGSTADVVRHDTIRSNMTHVLSDHSMIYADIKLP